MKCEVHFIIKYFVGILKLKLKIYQEFKMHMETCYSHLPPLDVTTAQKHI